MLPLHCHTPVGQGLLRRLPVVPVHVTKVKIPTTTLLGSGWLITSVWRELASRRKVDIASEADETDMSVAAAADAIVKFPSSKKL